MSKQELMPKILQACRDSWNGQEGEKRAASVEALLSEVLPNWSAALGLTEDQILAALESRRTYSAVNYYQRSRMPLLSDVAVYEDLDEIKALVAGAGFRCPSCGGKSTNAYECNAAPEKCNWKSYGLLGTLGKGHRFVLKKEFLEHPGVHETFMPIALEVQS